MCKNYDFENDMEAKTYGNLAVAIDKAVSAYLFGIIDNIEAK